MCVAWSCALQLNPNVGRHRRMSLLNSLMKLLTRDLTGRTWEKEATHPYFANLLYFGSKSEAKSYWEAELALPDDPGKRIGVTLTGTPAGPTEEEERFCRQTLTDPDNLFEKCRAAFEIELGKWVSAPMPTKWRDAFTLDGFQVPVGGDPLSAWEVCYFVNPARRYFTAVFENGRLKHVRVDG